MRCRHCGKTMYRNREVADKAARKINDEVGRQRMRVYLGHCGVWHLSSMKTMNEIRAKLGMDTTQEH